VPRTRTNLEVEIHATAQAQPADAVLEPRLVEKHGLPALVYVGQALASLERVRAELLSSVGYLVMSHGGAVTPEAAREVIIQVIAYIKERVDLAARLLAEPMLIEMTWSRPWPGKQGTPCSGSETWLSGV